MLHTKNKMTGKHESINQRCLQHADWGVRFFVDNEMEAYKAAYQYMHHAGEVKVECASGALEWMVTL